MTTHTTMKVLSFLPSALLYGSLDRHLEAEAARGKTTTTWRVMKPRTVPKKCQCGREMPAVEVKAAKKAFTLCPSCGTFVEQEVAYW